MTQRLFFIADMHLGHRKMVELRGFDDLDHMHQTFITNWNNTVTDDDKVYVLGDLAFNPNAYETVMPQLRGRKRLVAGNHDNMTTERYLKHFDRVYGAKEIMRGIILTHIPVHPDQARRFRMNIHGHLHTEKVMTMTNLWGPGILGNEIHPFYRCVSVEQTNYTPIEIPEVYL